MASGRSTQLTKQVGEYLVAAELCRRGFIAATFTGNVPHYDIIASDACGHHAAIQVKTSRGNSWHFKVSEFVTIMRQGKRQIVGLALRPPYPRLLYVFVRLADDGGDQFFLLTWNHLQRMIVDDYKRYLARHGGVRLHNPESMHTVVRLKDLKRHHNKWTLIERRLQANL